MNESNFCKLKYAALLLPLLVSLSSSNLVYADGGTGGNSSGISGGSGGTGYSAPSNMGTTGGIGGPGVGGGGGGGGGGAGGGLGAPGGASGGGGFGAGGQGGNGGANGNGSGSNTLTASATYTGSNGLSGSGAGGGTLAGGGGGGGGAGGYGAIFTGSNVTTSNSGSGKITGGNGGAGGAGGAASGDGGNGGNGGDGGIGIFFTGTNVIFNNKDTITGGNGGAGGAAGVGSYISGSAGSMGAGGTGILGNNLTIINSGSIIGGTGTLGTNGLGDAAIAGANLTVTNNGTITAGINTNTSTYADAIVFTSGSNTLTLKNNNTTTNQFIKGGIELLGTSTLTFNQTGNQYLANVIHGTGSVIIDASSNGVNLTLLGVNTYTGSTTIDSGTLLIGTNGSIADSSGVNLANTGVTFNISGSAAGQSINDLTGTNGSTVTLGTNTLTVNTSTNDTFAGAIKGNGGLTEQSTGKLVLSGTNTYTGVTTINSGTLAIGAGGNINDSSEVNLAAIGAAFDISAATTSQIIKFFNSTSGSTLNLGANTLTLSSSSNETLAGMIEGSGGNLNLTGGGTTIITGSNTYSGTTTLENGTLVLGSSTALGTSTLLTEDPTVTYTNSITVTNAIVLGGNTTLEVDNTDSATQAGVISETNSATYSVTKVGTGTLVLTGSNTYVGETKISGGTLAIGPGGSISVSSEIDLTSNDTTFDISTSTNGQSINNLVGVAGSSVTLGSNTLAVTMNNGETFAGVISGSGGGLTVEGTNTLTLTGTNTYTGLTTISSGKLAIGAAGNINASSGVDLTGSTAIFDITASTTTQSIGDLNGVTGSSISLGAKILTINTTTNDTFGGVISSTTSGGITVQGTNDSELILTGSNTYTGITTINSGTLAIGAGGSINKTTLIDLAVSGATFDISAATTTQSIHDLTSVSGSTLNLGGNNLTINTGTNDTLAGLIEGDGGSLTLSGGHTVTISGSNTYTGGTVLVSGTLVLANNNALGTGALTTVGQTVVYDNDIATTNQIILAGNTSLEVDGSNTATQGGVISETNTGTYNVTKTGTGTLVLTATNTYTGETVITTGTLAIGPGGSIADSKELNLTSTNVTFDISTSTNGQSVTDLVGVAGSAVTLGTNTLTVNTDTGKTFAGIISGTGGLTEQGTGELILTGSNTYTGVTTIVSGKLEVSGNGSIADSTGVDLTGSGAIFDIIPSSGPQSIGDLNGVSGSSVTLGANNLTVNTTTNDTFAGVISSSTSGSLTVQGSGDLILSGSNTYSNGTTIDSGTVTAESETALSSGNVSVEGGTLKLGDGTNTEVLSMDEDYTQSSSGTLYISLHSNTVSDSAEVSGTASLDGTLAVNFNGNPANNLPPGSPPEQFSYTILTSSNVVTGTFSSLDPIDEPTNDTTTILYNDGGDNVVLDVDAATVLFPTLGLTPNQAAVANAINKVLGGTNPPPAFYALTTALGTLYVNDPGAYGGALNQLMPLNFAIFTSSTAFNNASFLTSQLDSYLANHRGADGMFVSSTGGLDDSGLSVNNPEVDPGLQGIYSRLLAWSPAPSTGLLSDTPAMDMSGTDMKDSKNMVETSEAPVNLWNVYVSGNVVLAQEFSDSAVGTAHADATTGAVQAGFDYRITPHFLVGAMFAYGHTSATLDDLNSSASVDTYSPGVYASYSQGGWYANALGSYGFADYNQSRNVSIGSFGGTATSSPSGDQIVGDLDGGYDFHRGPWTFGPTLGVQYVHLDVDGYNETGLPDSDLTVNQDEADSLRSSLGGHINYAIKDGDLVFNPHLSASWQHEFLDQSRGITSQFDGVGAGSFVVQTPNPSRDSALVDVGLDAQVNDALTIFTDYTVQAGQSNYFGQSVQAGFKIGF